MGKKEMINSQYIYEIIGRYYNVLSVIKTIFNHNLKELSNGSHSVTDIKINYASGLRVEIGESYYCDISFLKSTSGWTLGMNEKNIIYPDVLNAIKVSAEESLAINYEITRFGEDKEIIHNNNKNI